MITRIMIAVFIVSLMSSCDQGEQIVDSGSDSWVASVAGFGLDSFRGDRSVTIKWNVADPPFMPSPDMIRPTPIATVRLYMSEEGPDQGYRPVFEEYRKRNDLIRIAGLANGRLYYFRLVGYDPSGNKVQTSRPIVTSPGRADQVISSFPANQFEDPQWVSALDWSPAFRKLAYVVSTSNQLSPEIFIFDLDTRENRQLTHYGKSHSNRRLLGVGWSPEGNAIAYCFTPSRIFAEIDYAIWVTSLNGGQPRRITAGRVDFDPLWTKTDEIIFCRGTYEPPNIPELWKANLTTGGKSVV